MVVFSGETWNRNITAERVMRPVAGEDGVVGINSNDAQFTFHHTRNVYKTPRSRHHFNDMFASDQDMDMMVPSVSPRRKRPSIKPPPPGSWDDYEEESVLSCVQWESTVTPLAASIPAAASTALAVSTLSATITVPPLRPQTPPTPSPYPRHRRTFAASLTPDDSISAVGHRHDAQSSTDLTTKLDYVSIDDICSALDQLGKRLVRLRVQILRRIKDEDMHAVQDVREAHSKF